MIPLRLELANFFSYRQPTVLDLNGVRLACISGENGAGKSTLLDAMTWVLFGKCRAPNRDDVVNRLAVAQGGAARVQLDLRLEKVTYRVLRTQPAGKTGLLEVSVLAGENTWRPLTESSIRSTQNQLESILRMNYETFVNSSFLLQGRADEFTVKGPADRKRILGELLGVNHWERYKDEAARRRKDRESERAGIDGRLEEIERTLVQEQERKQRLSDARNRQTTARAQRELQAKLVQSIQAYEAAVAQQRLLLQTLERNLLQAQRNLDRLTQTQRERESERDRLRLTVERADEIEQQYADYQQAAAALTDWETRAAEWNRLNGERNRWLLLITQEQSRLEQERTSLTDRQREMQALDQQLTRLSDRLEALTRTTLRLQEQMAARDPHQLRQAELQDQIGAIRSEQARLREDMTKLDGRRNQLRDEQTSVCPLCAQPLTAEHRESVLSQIVTEGTQMRDQFRANEERLRQAQEELTQIHTALQELTQVERELRTAERNETTARTQFEETGRALDQWSKQGAPRLAAVEESLRLGQYAAEAQRQAAELESRMAALVYQADEHPASRRRAESLSVAQGAHRQLGQAQATLQSVETTLADLAIQIESAGQQVEELSGQQAQARSAVETLGPAPLQSLAEAETELNRLREGEAMATRAVGAAEQAVEALVTLRQLKDQLQGDRQAMARTISRLRVLEKAFGRNGVQALLIEQGLPAIQDHANELLERLTAGGMRVRFSSQRQLKVKDALAETLEIHISDHAGERPYEMFSGGEAFRVNFAIRIALSQLLAQRAGARLQTLVIDEGFGSQDPEGRQRLVEVINSIQDRFAVILVITHIDELKDAFPIRIEVAKGVEGSVLSLN